MMQFKFNDLLPGSIKNDPKFKAASECLDALFAQTEKRVKELLIYSRVDELDEQTLDDLAWQFNLHWHDGYQFLTSIEEKRSLVKNAIRLKQHNGTRWALERIGEILNMPITVVEWWENAEYGTELELYEFDIFIDANGRGITDTFYEDAINLINSIKNVRSHLRKMQAMISIRNDFYMGAVCSLVDAGKVFPKFFKKMEIEMGKYMGAVGHHISFSSVYPEHLKNMQVKASKHICAMQYAANITNIYPADNSEISN
jgi:phage tail P2-like protein